MLPQKESFISEITAFEILIGARSKQQLESAKKLLSTLERIPIDANITQTAAQLCGKHPQVFDRNIAHTLFDAFIAATGIVKKLEVITLNVHHFTVLKERRLKIRVLREDAKTWA